ncbi:NADPH oxidase organizer 1-like [Pelobates fuscus]|uniref:NADPH oxidase organizer 1-like n=1 Tax=Pelobates fuscus TaxID=191477 RepID=UPI002FE4CACA
MPQRDRSGSDRHPLETTAIGYLQNGKHKYNMFSVLWSDRNEILIYRTFEDFKKLSRELRKKFPLESGLFRKSDNFIPKLKDVPVFRRNRNSSRFIERLRLLEKYSQELLKSDQKISQCENVVKFFTPKSHDLNPTFHENSLVIMPSETRIPKKEIPRPPAEPPCPGPIISQQYVCIEDYETKDTKNRAFNVKRNELLGVLVKESSGWWLVENEEKRVAWFPAPYLKDLENNEAANSTTDSDYDGILYYAAKGYESMSSDELSIVIGVLVEVIEKTNNGWWLVRYNGKAGYVPSMYLKPYSNYQQLQTMIKHGKLNSTPNLFKASSSLALNTSDGNWRSEDPGVKPSRNNAMKLDRKKSRSLNGFSSNMQRELANSPSRYGKISTTTSTDWKPKPNQGKGIQVQEQETRPEIVYGNYIIATPKKPVTEDLTSRMPDVPSTDPGLRPPRVPKRPKPHEILQKCTTVTKNALRESP